MHCFWSVFAGNTLSGAFDLYGCQATTADVSFSVPQLLAI